MIAEEVEHLTVFQRTPIWVIPKLDAPLAQPLRALLRHLPSAGVPLRWLSQAFVEAGFIANAHYHQLIPWMTRAFEALCREHLRRQVPDPVLRAKLTPDYGLGCKRPSFSNTYLRTFNRDHVELETTSIQEITPHGVRTADGREHRIDTLVLATGFKVFESGNLPPFPIRGTEGLDLDSWWSENRFQAYQGATVPGFPNLFTILGPYAYNGASYFQLIENQMRHITRCLRAARERGGTRIEITPRANDQYFTTMLGRRHRQIFFNNNCAAANSYYFDRHGDVPFRPATSIEAHWQSNHFNIDDYTIA